MRRSETVTRCACGEALPARYGMGGKPKKCEDCKQDDRARREREARARRKQTKEISPMPIRCADYEALRACWLSGQIDDAAMHAEMADDPKFAAWMRAKASITGEGCAQES